MTVLHILINGYELAAVSSNFDVLNTENFFLQI